MMKIDLVAVDGNLFEELKQITQFLTYFGKKHFEKMCVSEKFDIRQILCLLKAIVAI